MLVFWVLRACKGAGGFIGQLGEACGGAVGFNNLLPKVSRGVVGFSVAMFLCPVREICRPAWLVGDTNGTKFSLRE